MSILTKNVESFWMKQMKFLDLFKKTNTDNDADNDYQLTDICKFIDEYFHSESLVNYHATGSLFNDVIVSYEIKFSEIKRRYNMLKSIEKYCRLHILTISAFKSNISDLARSLYYDLCNDKILIGQCESSDLDENDIAAGNERVKILIDNILSFYLNILNN